MDYDQLREVLVNTENIYRLWQSTGLSEEEFIRANGSLIEESEKARLAKEAAKARQTKYLEKQKEEGRRHLTALVSSKTYDRLCRLRDQAIQAGEKKNLGQILDELLSEPEPDAIKAIANQIVEDAGQDAKRLQADLDQPTKKVTEKPLDLFNKEPEPDVIGIIEKCRDDGLTWEFIADQLNKNGIQTARGGKWTKANAQVFYSRNK